MVAVLDKRSTPRDGASPYTPATTPESRPSPVRVPDGVERRRRAEALVAAAAGDRGWLERVRRTYLDRLHRSSADFAATEGLRVVDVALALVPRPDGLWAWQRRETQPRRRRWFGRRLTR